MVNDSAKRCYAKKIFAGKGNFSALNKAKKNNVFVESLDQFRRLEVREKVRNVFVMSLRLPDHKVLHNIASVLVKFFQFRSDLLSFFFSYFVLSKLFTAPGSTGICYLTIIPFALVGCETGYSQQARMK